MAFLTHLGASTFGEYNFNAQELSLNPIRVVTNCTLNPTYKVNLTDLEVNVTTNCTLSFSTKFFTSLQVAVQTNAYMEAFVIREVPTTAKISALTINPAYATHTEFANNNLLYQFRGCPNNVKLLSCSMDELDKAQKDVYDFQNILNIEDAEGVNLDLCGAILGFTRVTGTTDLVHRNQLITQVAILTCDGTIPSVLKALIYMFNLAPNSTSYYELQIGTMSFNTLGVYVRDSDAIALHNRIDRIKSLIPAGASLELTTSNRYKIGRASCRERV